MSIDDDQYDGYMTDIELIYMTPNNKLAKLGDAIAISKSETPNHCRCWEMLSHLKTKYTKQNTKYMNLYSKILIYTVLLRGTFVAYFLQVQKIWWRFKNDKYQVWDHRT